MLVTIGDLLAMLSPTGILRCQCCWWRHPFAIQKFFAHFQIMSIGMMDLAPLFYTIRGSQKGLFSF
jgi:hypothetical protein